MNNLLLYMRITLIYNPGIYHICLNPSLSLSFYFRKNQPEIICERERERESAFKKHKSKFLYCFIKIYYQVYIGFITSARGFLFKRSQIFLLLLLYIGMRYIIQMEIIDVYDAKLAYIKL